MKYSIRQRVINSLGQRVTKIETIQGELGIGVLDKNGREIFEGDKIKLPDGRIIPVIFPKATEGFAEAVEVVGHIED